MKNAFSGEIDFPADPFVALADFLIVLLLVMILAVVHQSLGANKVIERTAVSDLQDRLLSSCWSTDDNLCMSAILRDAHARGEFKETYRDGDLQRFWFEQSLFFSGGSSNIATERGRKLLAEFGRILAKSQGDAVNPETRPFKRIIVEGHADRSEGPPEATWSLSLARANQAVILLYATSHLAPNLIEASGRGCWEPAIGVAGASPDRASQLNKRLEIVVVYAGRQSVDHINREARRRNLGDGER